MKDERSDKLKQGAHLFMFMLGPVVLQVLLLSAMAGGAFMLTESWPSMAPGMRQLVWVAACLVAVGAPMALYFTKRGRAARRQLWGPEGVPWAAARREAGEAREAGATEFEINKPTLACVLIVITLLLPGALLYTAYKMWGNAIACEWLPVTVCNAVATNLWARIALTAGVVIVACLPAIIVARVLKRLGWFHTSARAERAGCRERKT